jgi:hypothetical protein
LRRSLVLPAQHARLGLPVLGGGLVALEHPEAAQVRVRHDRVGALLEHALGELDRAVELAGLAEQHAEHLEAVGVVGLLGQDRLEQRSRAGLVALAVGGQRLQEADVVGRAGLPDIVTGWAAGRPGRGLA